MIDDNGEVCENVGSISAKEAELTELNMALNLVPTL